MSRAAEGPEEVIVVEEPFRLGPAAARNLGSREATRDVLVFLDADIEVHGDAFVRIRAAFATDPTLTAVFGSYDDDPAAGSIVSDFRNLLHHHVHHEGAGIATTFWAGLGAVRRDAFVRVGGFDEARFPVASIEDIEFGARLNRAGGRIVLDPAIQGKHLKRWTLGGFIMTDLTRRGVPWLRLMLEDRSHSTALNLGWRQRIGTGASVLLVAAVARRSFRVAAGLVALLGVIDRPFHAVLLRRSRRHLAVGIVLLLIHRITSAAAVPIALAGHVLRAVRRQR